MTRRRYNLGSQSRDGKNMANLGSLSTSYFYLHFLVIHEFGVSIPLTPFEVYFLVTANFDHSQTTPNVWSMIRVFEIICCYFGIFPTVGILFSFYGVESIVVCGWVILHSLYGRNLFEPYADSYEDWKDRFMQVRGQDGAVEL